MGRFKCRFAVGSPTGLRSGAFTVWTSRNDIYIAGRNIGGSMKTSLHESGKRHSGLTSTFFQEPGTLEMWGLANRHADEWIGGYQISETTTLEFAIAFPKSDLRLFSDPKLNPNKIKWLPEPPQGCHLEVALLIETEPSDTEEWPGKTIMGTQFLDSYVLPDGRILWLVYHSIPESPTPKSIHEELKLVIKKSMQANPNMQFTGGHRLIVGQISDDGVRCYVDLAADRYNN